MNNPTSREEMNKLVAAYILAIGPHGYPNSHVWVLVDPQMRSLDTHRVILDVLKGAGLVKEMAFFLTLTPKGLEVHNKIEALAIEAAAKVAGNQPTAPIIQTPTS